MQSVFEQNLERLVQKYDQPGPRYTSYPTVPVWSSGSFGREYKEALNAEGDQERGISIYIHIPFCRTLCTFCGCNKVITRDNELVERYLKALEQETASVANQLGRRKTLSQLHLGGGTPTFLNLDQLTRVTEMLRRHFDIDPGGEWALEANPRVTTGEQLKGLFELGFRRVSFGIQDMDSMVQEAINRKQTAEQSQAAFQVSKKIKYQSINFDLVYGLPLQTRSKFRRTLDAVSKMRPDRLAVYSFAHLPWMFKAHERALRQEDLPSAQEKIGLYLDTVRHFTGEGYVMIGMDHFALPDDELALALKNRTLHRNFMGYTTLHGLAQIGLGVSAISDFGDSYWQNPKNLSEYMEQVSDPKPQRGMKLDPDDQLRREVIERLMCHGEIRFDEFGQNDFDFREYFQEIWKPYEEFAKDGLVLIEPDRIKLTESGHLFMRNLAMPFDRYLQSSSSPRFSQTV
ncbi:MAG: oxygen-independent coproporphyrinogen III oxidase [Deltaproteobacteria bacterium]|nr:oxygen-independent coproporphyrinogen III oxidase [Deltaproteobacteria bacterium]